MNFLLESKGELFEKKIKSCGNTKVRQIKKYVIHYLKFWKIFVVMGFGNTYFASRLL